MVNKARPDIPITLDKPRKLRFDLNAMATFEDITGRNAFSGLNAKQLGARELRALLFACLFHEDETLTLKQVGSWITPENMQNVAAKMTMALEAAMPEPEKDAAAPLAGTPPAG